MTKVRIWILLLTLIPPSWITIRTLNLWDGKNAVAFLEQYDDRAAESMQVRFRSERVLSTRALEHPVSGWSKSYFITKKEVKEERGVPDQMWIIALGNNGLVGLISLTIALLMPIWLVSWRIPVRYWTHAGAAAVAALAMLLTLDMCDNLFNAMINPIFIIAAGGLTGLNFFMQPSTEFASRYRPAASPSPQLPYGSGAAPA